jgi:hypothetical protein
MGGGGSGRITRESDAQVQAQMVQKRGRAGGDALDEHDIGLVSNKQRKSQAAAATGNAPGVAQPPSCSSPNSKRARVLQEEETPTNEGGVA